MPSAVDRRGATPNALDQMHAPTRSWFTSSFAAPTQAQIGAWDAIHADGVSDRALWFIALDRAALAVTADARR